MLRFIRHLLYLLGAVQGQAHLPGVETEGQSAVPHRKERWGPGHLAEVWGTEALKYAHDLT